MKTTMALMALAALPALAQQGFDKPPQPAAPKPLQVPGFAQTRLPNGLTIVVAERRGLPLVTALMQVEAGSLLDPPGRAGLAALTFTVMGKGAQHGAEVLDASQLAAAAESLGGSLEIDTGAQASRLAMTVASNRLDASLALLADVARAPTLADEELERSRAQSLDAIKLGLSDPGALAALIGQRLFWGDTPYGTVTTPASLARIKREDVLAFHRQQLRPDRVTVVLAGDIDLAQARALVDKHFGNWRQNRMAVPQAPQLPPKPLATRAILLDLPGAGQSAVALLAPYIAQGNEPAQRSALRAGAVANAVLGVGYSSRINQEVRIKRGLSYGAASNTEARPSGGRLTAFAQTKHASALEVLNLLRTELLRLGTEDVPAPELVARQAVLVGDFGRQLETTAGLAAVAAEQVLRHRDLAELQQLPAELLAVDVARVRGFAAERWQADGLRVVVVGDLKSAGDELRKQYPDAWVIKAGELDLGSPNLRRAGKR